MSAVASTASYDSGSVVDSHSSAVPPRRAAQMAALPLYDPATPARQLASIPTLLSALKAHLVPRPVLGALPTALQIFAHLQLCLAQVATEARRALDQNDQLRAELGRGAAPVGGVTVDEELLSAKDEARLGKIVSGAQVLAEKMMAFSLGFRNTHMAILFSTPSIPPKQVLSLVDTYFPSPSSPLAQHRMLFNRIVKTPEHRRLVQVTYRKTVMDWYAIVDSARAKGEPRPTFQDLTGSESDQERQILTLTRGLLRYADEVARYHNVLEAMFSVDQAGDVAVDQVGEVNPEHRGERKDAVSIPTNGITHAAYGRLDRRQQSADFNSTTHEAGPSRHRNGNGQLGGFLKDAQASDDRSAHAGDAQRVVTPQPASVSVAARGAGPHPASDSAAPQSRSPSPNSVARLPRVDFSGRSELRRVARSRSSLGSLSSPFTPSFVQRSDPVDPQVTATSVGRSGGTASRQSDVPSRLARSTSGVAKKRPRTSFPPVTGPDYTAPDPSFSSNVDKASLRPFDSSRLVKRPRVSHPVQTEPVYAGPTSVSNDIAADTDARRSSQDSQESVRPAAKRDKGKRREVPRMQVDVLAS